MSEPKFLPKIVRQRGRANLFQEIFIRQAYYFSLMGATDSQLAQVFNVSEPTIVLWKRTKPEFLKAIKEGKLEADANVAASLYHAAIGYTLKETVVLSNKKKKFDEKGKLVSEETTPLLVTVDKNYPPNVTAALKWLSIRQPELWTDKIVFKGDMTVNHKIDLSGFTNEELVVLNKLGISKQQAIDTDYEEVG